MDGRYALGRHLQFMCDVGDTNYSCSPLCHTPIAAIEGAHRGGEKARTFSVRSEKVLPLLRCVSGRRTFLPQSSFGACLQRYRRTRDANSSYVAMCWKEQMPHSSARQADEQAPRCVEKRRLTAPKCGQVQMIILTWRRARAWNGEDEDASVVEVMRVGKGRLDGDGEGVSQMASTNKRVGAKLQALTDEAITGKQKDGCVTSVIERQEDDRGGVRRTEDTRAENGGRGEDEARPSQKKPLLCSRCN